MKDVSFERFFFTENRIDRLAPYSPSIIYAPTAFQKAFLARLRSPRFFDFGARFRATEYRDLLARFGDNYFAMEAYLHDNYLVKYEYGPDLKTELQDMLEAVDSSGA